MAEQPTRILLIEDSPTQALEIKLSLEEKGLSVEIAPDGQLGLDRALTRSFDLILLDYYLPLIEGLEFVGCLKYQKIKTPGADRENQNRLTQSSITELKPACNHLA
ncbi:MAG: response regulator transcription factor [Candidatus Binatia bacterium]